MADSQIINGNIVTPGVPTVKVSEVTSQVPGTTTQDVVNALSLTSPTPSKVGFIDNIVANIVAAKNAVFGTEVAMQRANDPGTKVVYTGPDSNANGLLFREVDFTSSKPQGVNNLSPSNGREVEVTPAITPVAPEVKKDSKSSLQGKPGSGFMMQDSFSGSDLSIFYLVEYPNADDIAAGMTPDACRKEIVMLEFDSVLSLSYSTIREKFPVRSLGHSNPLGITSGIRTISGHITFNVFAEDILSRLRSKVSSELENKNLQNKDILQATPLLGTGYKSMLLDQLPPFHLLIMGTTERGTLSRMMIKNVSIIDENQYQGTQQPNVVNKVTFVAQDVVPMTARQYDSTVISSSITDSEEGYVGGNYDYGRLAEMTGSSILSDSIYRQTVAESN